MANDKLKRLFRAIRRELVQRRLPHGLMSPVYFLPAADEYVRLHRSLWWKHGERWFRPLWLAAEFWLWLRWVAWYAVPACRRSLRRVAAVVEREEGIPRRVQGLRTLKLALFWCIPPWESYRYRLYCSPNAALGYIYEAETFAFHVWRSEPLGLQADSIRRLQDKLRLTEELSGHGIPMAATLAVVRKYSEVSLLHGLVNKYKRVFCKTNSGNQGLRAFAAWSTPDGIKGQTFDGASLPDAAAVDTAWGQLLSLDNVLIQPCLENHSELALLAYNQEAITVRFVSQWNKARIGEAASLHCLSATLEVPAGRTDKGHTFYSILPIHPETGAFLPPMRRPIVKQPVHDAVLCIQAAVQAIHELPDWSCLADLSYRAHALFPDVCAIAWDWVLTPSGPVLLEGNFGWGTEVAQEKGGLIAAIGMGCKQK